MSVLIGLSNLHYAELLTDVLATTPTYDTPVAVAGVISANVNPNYSDETLYADDGPYEAATTLGKIELELNVAELDLATQAFLLGHVVRDGILFRKSTDTPPYVAIGFKSLKTDGTYRYTWLAKGKFSPSEQNNETKNEAVNFQTPTIKGNFVKRTADDEWERHTDEGGSGWQASYATDWWVSPTEVGGI